MHTAALIEGQRPSQQGATSGVFRQIDSSPRGKCQESVNQLITLVFERVRFSSDEAGLPSSSRLYQSSEALSSIHI